MPARRKRTAETWDAFAVAAPGIEGVVASELEALGVNGGRVIDGGVEFTADRTTLYRANLHLRTASRVIVRLASFRAVSFAELEQRAKRVPWERVMSPGTTFHVRVTCRKSRLYHSGGVAQRLARDIQERLAGVLAAGAHGTGDSPEDDDGSAQLFVVRMDHDRCTISADSSGALLHLRGYRTAVTGAPMRETLAASLILASGWTPAVPLLDPFCGTGTIPIEAALIATRRAPGRHRSFRFTEWPGHDEPAWQRIRTRARDSEVAPTGLVIAASDQGANAIRAALANAERADVAGMISFTRQTVTNLVPPEGVPGWIITNPPYGVRLGDERDVRELYATFRDVLLTRFAGWRVGALLGPSRAAAALGLPDERLRTTNGGIAVRFMAGEVPA
jgi:putative N6-adenine-specific DNA methylase